MPSIKSLHRLIDKSRNRKKQFSNSAIQQFNFGFTLIELLVVITIIAILVGAASASWTNAQKKSRDGKRKSDLKGTQQALELYFQRNSQYPTYNATDGTIRCNTDADYNLIPWGGNFSCGGGTATTTYMNPLPKDPINQPAQHFVYFYESFDKNDDLRPDSYKISSLLENAKDPDNKDGPNYDNTLPCDPAPSYNYCVINP